MGLTCLDEAYKDAPEEEMAPPPPALDEKALKEGMLKEAPRGMDEMRLANQSRSVAGHGEPYADLDEALFAATVIALQTYNERPDTMINRCIHNLHKAANTYKELQHPPDSELDVFMGDDPTTLWSFENARTIGKELSEVGGLDAMKKAFEEIGARHGLKWSLVLDFTFTSVAFFS